MGRPLKIKSPEEMEQLWEEYKQVCDDQEVLTHEFSSKNSEFVSAKLKRSITYTIEGFCVYMKISRQAFYEYYVSKKRYVDIVTRIREECEADARKKFELQVIPSQLAGLWMSKYGYTTKVENNLSGGLDTEKSKLDDLIDQMRGGD
ncbi:terminase small subunit [Hungatella effluvii]|uniref:terminase small subunit n=1 Tax=Hungatella effluvii TaxID=1096246 RepID=UPI002A827515|nr:terminase small subunit [Hungatella effluvii]